MSLFQLWRNGRSNKRIAYQEHLAIAASSVANPEDPRLVSRYATVGVVIRESNTIKYIFHIPMDKIDQFVARIQAERRAKGYAPKQSDLPIGAIIFRVAEGWQVHEDEESFRDNAPYLAMAPDRDEAVAMALEVLRGAE